MRRFYHIETNCINSLQSIDPHYIKFPYNWETATAQEQANIMAEIADCRLPKQQQIAGVTVYVSFTVCKRDIFAQLHIITEATSGRKYPRCVAAELDYRQAENILQAFIAAGLPGLDETSTIKQVQRFKHYIDNGKNKTADQMIAQLKAGMCVNSVLTAASV